MVGQFATGGARPRLRRRVGDEEWEQLTGERKAPVKGSRHPNEHHPAADDGPGEGREPMTRHRRRYLNRVARDRERIARGELTENGKWAAYLIDRVRHKESADADPKTEFVQ